MHKIIIDRKDGKFVVLVLDSAKHSFVVDKVEITEQAEKAWRKQKQLDIIRERMQKKEEFALVRD
ncbi:hypothetical protein [Thermodesulfovibrio yellowstonii]|uniref:hypothetical protein n=1 Tax=Thermodesulfovibrio yellowstonii TaxID=28262 RepID=UPI0004195A0F|nr:hypothetical protein [Thermodesulfovibrio islandicus]